MPLRPKKAISRLESCAHGGFNYEELRALGVDADEIIDFSVSINPFMPPPGIRESLSRAAIDRYPDSQVTELREKLALKLKVPMEKLLAGNGTTELIRLVATTYFRRGDRVLIVGPTYGEYEPACKIAGARTISYRAKEKDGFEPDIEEITRLIRENNPRGVFLCNPNNPTGKYTGRKEIERILDTMEDGLLVMDEAYVAFVEESWNSPELTERDNIVILRSMTKDYGMPGLRLGYAIACREIIDSLRRVVPPWNVNIAAQTIGADVLDKDEYLRHSLVQVREAKRFLAEEIAKLGLKVMPSSGNYFMVKVGNGNEFRDRLLKKGMQVRDCASFGLAEYVRIAPRTMPECYRLVEAIKSITTKRDTPASGKGGKRL